VVGYRDLIRRPHGDIVPVPRTMFCFRTIRSWASRAGGDQDAAVKAETPHRRARMVGGASPNSEQRYDQRAPSKY